MRWSISMKRAAGVMMLLALCSCASDQPGAPAPAQASFSIAPRDMLPLVKQAIAAEPMNLAVAQDQGSVLVTSWREGYRGNFHIARYWQERTQFRISVIPDWQDPQNRCRIEITENTEERSNTRGEWRRNGDTTRPERSEELLRQIESHLPGGTAAVVTPVLAPAPAAAAASPAPAPAPTVTPQAPAPMPAAASTTSTPRGWNGHAGTLTTTLSVADAGQRVDRTVKAMALNVHQSNLTAIDGLIVVQGATGPEITITIQADPSGVTTLKVTQANAPASANGAMIFARLQQELTR